MIRSVFLALLLLPILSLGAAAVEPDEILTNGALEQRAREITKGLRCLVCRNESIDDSNADLARDLRRLVRERLVRGDSNDAVIQYVVARYGDYVLLQPPVKPKTWLLWFGPPLVLVAAGAMSAYALRRSDRLKARSTPLSAEEQARLDDLLDDRSRP